MTDSASSKVDRAAKHVTEINDLFREHRPFTYVLETNIRSGERATYAKRNVAIIENAANIAADIVHNLRTALDHAYWEIVCPFAKTPREEKAIQFPFSETAARLDESVKNRLANRVSDSFFQALIDLKPHGEHGGNEILYSIHELDALDKHRFPIPTGDYKTVTGRMLRENIPGFPMPFTDNSTISLGSNGRDFAWRSQNTWHGDPGIPTASAPHIFEKEIKIPVDIVFSVRSTGPARAMIPTLHQMCDAARSAIKIIREAV